MFSLESISKMNTLAALAKERMRAKSLNSSRGHAKDAEKGRKAKRQFKKHLELASKTVATWPAWKRNVLG